MTAILVVLFDADSRVRVGQLLECGSNASRSRSGSCSARNRPSLLMSSAITSSPTSAKNRLALRGVGVEERVGRPALQHRIELPPEVRHVLQAVVEPVATIGGWLCAASPAMKTLPFR